MHVYLALRRFLRLAASVFFGQIEVVGLEHVPAQGEGPVIFAGNHPNSLLDPVLILSFSGRVVRFAAKDVLFKSRALGAILRSLGAVPVARRSDYQGASVDNDGAFQALADVLVRGEAMGIFPEGLSHDDTQLKRLKTGAARIALSTAAAHPGVRIRVVPTGLTYIHPKRFASRVLLQFGPAIEVGDADLAAYAADEREAVRDLTARIEAGMRALTVNAADWDTLCVLDGVRRIYQPSHISIEDRVTLARRFNEVYPKVKDEPAVVALYERVKDYQDRLRAAGLTDRDLRRQIGPLEALRKVAQHLLLALVWLPLAAPGIVLHAPIGLLASWAGRNLTPRRDVTATTKLIVGMLGVLLLYAALVALVVYRLGPVWGLAAAALLPITGHATLRVVSRSAALRKLTVTLTRLVRLGEEVEALRRERAELEELVVAAVERFRPADMVPLFPRTPAASTTEAGPEPVPAKAT